MSGVSVGRTWAWKPPSGNPEGLALLGELVWVGRLVGGTDWGDCGRKVSTHRKHACIFAGSDVRGKCKRITLTLSSVLTYGYTCRYRYTYVCRSMYHVWTSEKRAGGPPPPGEWGGSARDISVPSLTFYILRVQISPSTLKYIPLPMCMYIP